MPRTACNAIDVQDHSKEGQINRNVLIEDVYALRCQARRSNRESPVRPLESDAPRRHGERMRTVDPRFPYRSRSPSTNVPHSLGNTGSEAIKIENCRGVNVRDVRLVSGAADSTGLLILDCSRRDGRRRFALRTTGRPRAPRCDTGLPGGGAFSNLRIHGVFAKHVRDAGIVLEKRDEGATLEDYIVCGNVSRVIGRNRWKGRNDLRQCTATGGESCRPGRAARGMSRSDHR